MTAPTRVVLTDGNAYRLDPYVRDEGGRFALKPTVPLPPLQLLEESGQVRVLANGAVTVSGDPDNRNYWRVRCVRESDGGYRVLYEGEEG